MLYLNTVSSALLTIIQRVSKTPDFDAFRLVGGTALSLYLGHRISIAVSLDANIVLINSYSWQEIQLKIDIAISTYFEEVQLLKELKVKQREQEFQTILGRKKI